MHQELVEFVCGRFRRLTERDGVAYTKGCAFDECCWPG